MPCHSDFHLCFDAQVRAMGKIGEGSGKGHGLAGLPYWPLLLQISFVRGSLPLPTLTDKSCLFLLRVVAFSSEWHGMDHSYHDGQGTENTLCAGQCVKRLSCINLLHPHNSVVAYITMLIICAYGCDVGVCVCVCLHAHASVVYGAHKTTLNIVPQVLWKFWFFELESLIGLGFTN